MEQVKMTIDGVEYMTQNPQVYDDGHCDIEAEIRVTNGDNAGLIIQVSPVIFSV